jgi:hypothetical protein
MTFSILSDNKSELASALVEVKTIAYPRPP